MHFGKKFLQPYHFWHTTSLLICELDLLNTFFGRTVTLGRATLLPVSPFAYFKLGQMHRQVIQLCHKLALLLKCKVCKLSKQICFSLPWALSTNQPELWCHVGFGQFLFASAVSPQHCRTAALYWQKLSKGASVPRNWICHLAKGKISTWLSLAYAELLSKSVCTP